MDTLRGAAEGVGDTHKGDSRVHKTLHGWNSTIEECRRIVYERRDAIDRQLKELKLARDFIEYKCWFYDVAREPGTCGTPRTMPYDEPPDDIRHREARCGTPGMTARSGYPGRAYALGRSV